MRASVCTVESRPGFDDHFAPHGMVGNATIFMAQERVCTSPLETGRDTCDLAGQQHGIDVGSAQQEPMDNVLAGRYEGDFRALRYPDLRRIEKPDAGHQMCLISTRGNLDHA